MPLDYFQIGNRRKCSQVGLLANCLRWILRAITHQRGKIFDLVYLVFCKECIAQFRNVEPAVRCISQPSVVEIECVNIDVGLKQNASIK